MVRIHAPEPNWTPQPTPASWIYLYVRDKQDFCQRLGRGTKNEDFAHWESNVWLDEQYELLFNQTPEMNVLRLESTSDKQSKKRIVEKTIEFVTRDREVKPLNSFFNGSHFSSFDVHLDAEKIIKSRKRAKVLLKQTDVRGNY